MLDWMHRKLTERDERGGVNLNILAVALLADGLSIEPRMRGEEEQQPKEDKAQMEITSEEEEEEKRIDSALLDCGLKDPKAR
jgi:hypothetical protein